MSKQMKSQQAPSVATERAAVSLADLAASPDFEQRIKLVSSLCDKEAGREITSDRDKIRLDHHGDYVMGRLMEVREFAAEKPTDKPQRVAYLNLPGGEQVRMNLSTDLAKKITGDMVLDFIVILNVGTLNTGHKTGTPMTIFRVWDYGQTLPVTVAALAEDHAYSVVES